MLNPLTNKAKSSPKSMKNRAWDGQNPTRFEPSALNQCQIDARTSQSQYFDDFGGAFWRSKYEENHLILVKIQTAFQ